MQAQDDLLVFFLDRDKAHLGTGDGFTDGGGIRSIILAAATPHAVWGNELWRNQFDGVAVLTEQACPVMGAATGFHADQARRELHDQRQELLAADTGFDPEVSPRIKPPWRD